MIPWWKVDLGPQAPAAVAAAVADRRISLGPLVAEFERRLATLLEVPHVVATTSGTTALTLALMEAGVGPGDEVIVPNRTWIATAHAAHTLGATVVLAEVEAERPLLDPEACARAITARTRAIVPVHLNGRIGALEPVLELARRHRLAVVEDAAQALAVRGTDGRFLGTCGRSGGFSLSVAKLITSGQGGFVATRDDEVARRLRLMRTHGTADVVDASWLMAGTNVRFTDLQAALALTQLDLLPARIAGVLRVWRQYADGWTGIAHATLLPARPDLGELPIYVECQCPRRAGLMAHLAAAGIQTRPMYPDLHRAPQFAARNPGPYPRSRRFGEDCLVLPCGPDQDPADIARVLQALRAWRPEGP
jgi:perosamine synthetase